MLDPVELAMITFCGMMVTTYFAMHVINVICTAVETIDKSGD